MTSPARYHREAVPRVLTSPRAVLILSWASLVTVILNVATGAAVRLSNSGLGCPDWPTCAQRQLTPPLSLHPVVEFGNRMVVVVLVVVCGATWVAAMIRQPKRRDLRWLSGGLILGVVAEAVFGAVVVYTHLNAYVVMAHFMIGIALLSVAVVLTLRANEGSGRGVPVVSTGVLWATRAYLVLLTLAIAAGTATTGAGPHAGGPDAKRVPIALSAMSRIHAETVLITGGLLLAILWVLWRADAPGRVQDAGRVLLAAMAMQGIVGYTQYFTHLPAILVGIHVLGSSIVWSIALWFHHRLSDHEAEVLPPSGGPDTDASTTPGTEPVSISA